jgi:hypothetical protein
LPAASEYGDPHEPPFQIDGTPIATDAQTNVVRFSTP